MEIAEKIKHKPILFSTPMVQAILKGEKTQTRRIVKGNHLKLLEARFTPEYTADPGNYPSHGSKGDILWVRETFNSYNESFYKLPDKEIYLYKADGTDRTCTWKPSIFMPKAACRIFLEITNIRIERLQDISGHDAKAEGIEVLYKEHGVFPMYKDYLSETFVYDDEKKSYQSLWQKINGADSWNKNPWVWVIKFKRIEKPEGFL